MRGNFQIRCTCPEWPQFEEIIDLWIGMSGQRESKADAIRIRTCAKTQHLKFGRRCEILPNSSSDRKARTRQSALQRFDARQKRLHLRCAVQVDMGDNLDRGRPPVTWRDDFNQIFPPNRVRFSDKAETHPLANGALYHLLIGCPQRQG